MNTELITNPVHQEVPFSALKPTYGFVSTDSVIETFKSNGWYVAEEKIAQVRKAEKMGFQRHIVRLHNDSFASIPGLTESNSSRPELCLLNSHDGSTSLRIIFGILRIACLNGILAGTSLREFRTVHSGDLTKKVTEGVEYMTTGIPDMISSVQALQSAQFTPANQDEFVRRLVDERLKTVNPTTVDYSTALKVLRNEDDSTDAFTIFNRVQEHLIRGGIEYKYMRKVLDDTGNVVDEIEASRTTRKLASIPQAIKLNRMAYDLAVQLAA